MSRRQLYAGFNLTELVITLAIILILVAISFPSFSHIIDGKRLTNQARGMSSLILRAKSEALKRSSSTDAIYLVIQPGNAWHIGLATAATGCTSPASCTIDLGAGSEVHYWSNSDCQECKLNSPSVRTVIEYNFRGLVNNATLSTVIEVESPQGQKIQLTINKVGVLGVCSLSGSTGFPAC